MTLIPYRFLTSRVKHAITSAIPKRDSEPVTYMTDRISQTMQGVLIPEPLGGI
jgi:hypothetical protein